MPGEVSRSNPGPGPDAPYVPSWCYDPPGPRMCACGHHEGYHNDAGECLQRLRCGCKGMPSTAGVVGAQGGDGWRTSADGLTRTKIAPDAASPMVPSQSVTLRMGADGRLQPDGVDSVQAPSAKLADLRGVLRPDQVYRQQCPDGVRCLNGCHKTEPCWHEKQQAKRAAAGVPPSHGGKKQ